MRKIHLIFVLLWTISVNCYGQNPNLDQMVKSFKKSWDEMANIHPIEHPDSSIMLSHQVIQQFSLIHKIDSTALNPILLYEPYRYIAISYYVLGKKKESIPFFEVATNISSQGFSLLRQRGYTLDEILGDFKLLRDIYQEGGDYYKALGLSDSIVNLYIQLDPKKAAYHQIQKSEIYMINNDITNVVNSHEKALYLLEAYGNDVKDLSVELVINELLGGFLHLNMYDRAFIFIKEHLDKLTKNIKNPNREELNQTNKFLYQIHYHNQHYYKAATYALQVSDYIRQAEEYWSESNAIWLGNAACAMLDEYESDKNPSALSHADSLLNYAKEIWEQIPEHEKSTNYIIFLGNYGNLQVASKEKAKARLCYQQMLTLSKQIKDDDLILSAMSKLAYTYKGQEAIDLYKELIVKYEERKDTLHTARMYHLVSQESWETLENPEQAERYANRALELLTQSNVKNSTTCNVMENLARLYFRMGLELRAFDTYSEALNIKRSQNMDVSELEWLTCNEFFVECFRMLFLGHPKEHKEEMIRIEKTCNEILAYNPDNKILCERTMTLLAKLYMYFQQFTEAEEIFQKILSIKEKLWGKNSYNYIVTLEEMAQLFAIKGDIKKERDLFLEIVKYHSTLGIYKSILNASIMLKDIDMIEDYLPTVFDKSLDYLKESISFMSSWQREYLLRNGSDFFEIINPAFLYPQNESFAQYAYNAAIISKGLLLSTERNIGSSIRMVSDSILMAKHKEVTQIEEQIQQSKDSTEFMSLNHQLEFKEKELLSLLKEKSDITHDLDLTWLDIQEKLGENDIAIEFVYNDSIVTVPTEDNSTAYYGALLIRKNWDAPKVVRLSQMTETDSLIREIITTCDDEIDFSNDEWSEISSRLYTKIWEPIIQYIKPGDRILYSPVNMLSIMPWEACAINGREYMNEQYDMVRLSTTKYICNSTASHNIDQAVLYGGLIYDSSSTATPPKDASPSKRTGWQYLSDTADEVKNIAEIFKENNIPTTIYSKKEGTEESFKSLSCKNIPLLHIATHGFYFNDQESMTYDFMNDINAPFKRGMDTSVLLRSGLMLSNGQKAWLEGHTSLNEEDGILLASEISLLDLHNVDLVTLSACQTGLGEIRSDGVYGLQRAFKKAGVNSMLMTLWTVESESAQILMTQFYKNLLSGQSKRQSLLSAQKYLREYNNGYYNKPRYWAAFILLDGL